MFAIRRVLHLLLKNSKSKYFSPEFGKHCFHSYSYFLRSSPVLASAKHFFLFLMDVPRLGFLVLWGHGPLARPLMGQRKYSFNSWGSIPEVWPPSRLRWKLCGVQRYNMWGEQCCWAAGGLLGSFWNMEYGWVCTTRAMCRKAPWRVTFLPHQ